MPGRTSPETREKGEHFLVDEKVIARIVESAALKPGETVLDVGSGRGALTMPCAQLVQPGGRVVAVEKDPEWAARLREREVVGLEVIEADALKVNLPPIDAVVANPPYRIIPGLLRRLLSHGFGRAVLVVPTELRDRLVAEPRTELYGKLTVEVGVRAKVRHLFDIPRRAFEPRPEVDSAVILVTMRPAAATGVDLGMLERILEVAWTERRKDLRNALADLGPQVGMTKAEVETVLKAASVEHRRFAEVSPFEFGQLSLRLREALESRRAETARAKQAGKS